jgi:hypothetical protein
MTNLKVFLLVPVLLVCLPVSVASAEMSSTSYRITSSVISGGGSVMSATNYRLVSTLGQPTPPGNSSSTNYNLNSGFWYTVLVNAVGDVNGDSSINLADVIAALQVVTGQSPVTIIKEADADGDGKIGLSEALMVLLKISE